ncbi:hypothetical protein [Streptomyces sp. NPDC060366]|uniref:hypothetical protein n=1 Tax=Streptomyces sp. NPDC060366 TaxID=3347105 RepID=UPI00365976C0
MVSVSPTGSAPTGSAPTGSAPTGPAPTVTLSPLLLPMPDEEPANCSHPDCPDLLRVELSALRHALSGEPPATHIAPSDEVDRARHRWFVGHHAAFAVWQLQARALHAVAATPEPAAQPAVIRAATLYDAYSVLFLYSGSCSPELYAAVVRPHISAAHPAFSGAWARDHAAVPAALRVVRARHPAALLAPLTRAVRDNQRAHMAVAGKLVPSGASLLQQAGRHPANITTAAEHDLYDAYFRVHRQPVCRLGYETQLVRRLAQCASDIIGYGLGPNPDGCPERFTHDALSLLTAPAEHIAARQAPTPPLTKEVTT